MFFGIFPSQRDWDFHSQSQIPVLDNVLIFIKKCQKVPECAQKGRFCCLVKFAQIITVYNSFNGPCLYDLVKIVEFSENSEEGGIFNNYT